MDQPETHVRKRCHMLLRISEEKKVGGDFGPRNGRMVGKPKLHLFNEVSINVLI